jgi:hypothetical protein
MSKMSSHDPFGHLNISYGQKKSRESNWQFDSRSLKVKNQLDFLVYMWHATYRWKALDNDYHFALDLISIKGLHVKLWGPKVAGVLTLGIPRSKCHLDVGLVERHKVYYKGESGGFPRVRAVLSLVIPSLPVVRPSTKCVPTMH